MISLPSFFRTGWRSLLMLPTAVIAQDAATPTPPPAPAVPPPAEVTLSTGLDYSRGDYGFAADTEVFAVPLTVSYATGPWRFQVSQAWLSVDGPASVVLTGAQAGGAAGRPVSSRESGVGDLWLGATYRSLPFGPDLEVAFTGRMKVGTANENKGLGTGENDYYAQFDFSRTVGATTPYLTVGYRWLGANAAYPLRDGAYFSAGFVRQLSGPTQAGLAVDWRARVVSGGDPACELTAFVTHHLDESWSLQGYALTGLTDASPNFGLGTSVNYRF